MALVKFSLAAALAWTIAASVAQAQPVLHTEGDFDGDGRRDRAALECGADYCRLVVRLGRVPDQVVVLDEGPRSHAGDFLRTSEPGIFDTFPFEDSNSEMIVTQHDAISYGTSESSESLTYWTGEAFRTVWLSD